MKCRCQVVPKRAERHRSSPKFLASLVLGRLTRGEKASLFIFPLRRNLLRAYQKHQLMLELKVHTQECQEEWGSKSLIFQGAIATTLTQPLDVCKTRAMNAKPGEFKGLNHHSSATELVSSQYSILFPGALDLIRFTARQGPLAFYKGYVPAFVRLGPHTVLTFIFLEQLKKNFGHVREEAS